jgi:two-component sensor histidine kinase
VADVLQTLTGAGAEASAVFAGDEPISEARGVAQAFLSGLRERFPLAVPEAAAQLVLLVVSELATNARKYAPGPYLLTLALGGGSLTITVWDSNPTLPLARATDPERPGQHGLEILTAMCEGLAMHREPVGKRVSATIALPGRPA